MPAELIRILLQVSRILEKLNIPYLTGGSIASSILGIPRATQDIDVVIDLPLAKFKDFVKAMQPGFYIDSDRVSQAVQRRSSFNAIHFETVQKIDFFIQGDGDYAKEEMSRRLKMVVEEFSKQTIFIASPEDIILQKLVWYKMGSRISERQWSDVLGVIKVQGDRLDRVYLTRWAKELKVPDLLEEALREDGRSPD
jgi:hypothetical protein